MRILIIGANGMLGHQLYRTLENNHDVHGTIRGGFYTVAAYGIFDQKRISTGIDLMNTGTVEPVISKFKPDAVINAAGIVKSLEAATATANMERINARLPHDLYNICHPQGIRVIHISTDCVFSGRKGNYTEDDIPDADDIYGQTKQRGEITGDGALTIRTSIIGRELGNRRGLLEWFLGNRGGTVSGYTNAIFTGFPTLHLSRIIRDILEKWPELTGLYHVSSAPISKYGLLGLINTAMKLNISINEYPDEVSDRSLDSTRFRRETGFSPLSWEEMIAEMARDIEDYHPGR